MRGQVGVLYQWGYGMIKDFVVRPLLRGLSLSAAYEEPGRVEVRHLQFDALVTVDGKRLLVSNIPSFPERAPWCISPSSWNLDPRYAGWQIEILPKLHSADKAS